MTHEEYVARQRSRVVELAKGILAGAVNVLGAARELAGLRHEVEVQEDDPDFMVFEVIADGAEHLPIGRQRSLWSPEGVEARSAEIEEREAWAKEDNREACLSIIKRFGGA